MEIKNKIKLCFNKAYKTYDQHSVVQKKVCLDLMKSLLNFNGHYDNIADFACGTGVSIQHLKNYFSYHNLYGLDFSNNLLSIAKKRYSSKKTNFILSDFDKPIFKNDSINLIVSNMGMQWSLDLKGTLKLFYSYLREEGRLAFSMPLQGTFFELNPLCRNDYYTQLAVIEILYDAGFTVEMIKKINYVEKFLNQIEALRSIKSVGANCKISRGKSKVKDFFINKSETQLTYIIGTFVACKLD